MSIQDLKVKLTGITPLLVHNGMQIDYKQPLTRAASAIQKKRVKTDADKEELDRLRYIGSFYLDENQRPILPWYVVRAAIVDAAPAISLGTQAKTGIFIKDNPVIEYGSDLTPEQMFNSPKHVSRVPGRNKSNNAGIMIIRPQFPDWSLSVTVKYADEILNKKDVVEIIERAGRYIGIGNWRPAKGGQCGMFTVEVDS